MATAGSSRPVLVKLSPDLAPDAFETLVAALVDASVAGIVVANTSTTRHDLRDPAAAEAGGLSGAPLLPGMLDLVRRARAIAGSTTAIVASGGICSAEDVAAAYAAGADLVQLWTGLVYRGPGLIGEAVAVRAGA
jgi:dihydroorotate dehydrogenase